MSRAPKTDTLYDVLVLGSGLAGSTLATILSRHGLKVLMLEAAEHPRFAIGESVVPEFGARAQLLAHVYDVEELGQMGDFPGLSEHVSGNSGVKRSFTFVRHEPGVELDPANAWQFQTLTQPLGPDSHIYRPDLDTWLTALAVRYGTDYLDRTPVTGIEVGADEVLVRASEQQFRGRFVVDGTGYRSILAEQLELRDPRPLTTNSRTIFSHVVGMGQLERACEEQHFRLPLPSPTDQGTLHHVFDGGWFWVIPFGNHAEATNPLCSVGLTLDCERYPDTGLSAEAEFFTFVDRFPTLQRQFRKVRAMRRFVKTPRMQFHSRQIAGDRWCLLPHAAGFVDPLFSGGMTLSLIGIHEVAGVLLESFKTNQFAAARFDAYQLGSRQNLEAVDQLVHGAYLAMRSPGLFNAWFRHWAVCNFHAVIALTRVRLEYEATGDRRGLDDMASPPCCRILGMGHPRLREFLATAYGIVQAVDQGALTQAAGADQLFDHLGSQDWIPPQFHIAERQRGHLASFTALPMTAIILWGRRRAPADMRRPYYAIRPIYYRKLVGSLLHQFWRGTMSFVRSLLGTHFARPRA